MGTNVYASENDRIGDKNVNALAREKLAEEIFGKLPVTGGPHTRAEIELVLKVIEDAGYEIKKKESVEEIRVTVAPITPPNS